MACVLFIHVMALSRMCEAHQIVFLIADANKTNVSYSQLDGYVAIEAGRTGDSKKRKKDGNITGAVVFQSFRLV